MDFFLLFSHYNDGDLVTAGMPRQAVTDLQNGIREQDSGLWRRHVEGAYGHAQMARAITAEVLAEKVGSRGTAAKDPVPQREGAVFMSEVQLRASLQAARRLHQSAVATR